MKETKSDPITVHLKTEHGDTKTKNLHAFLVDEGGRVHESVPFKENVATFKSAKSKFEGHSKVYIAHGIPKDTAGKVNELTLIKIGGYNAVKNFIGSKLVISKLPIGVFNPPFFNNCLITGHVSKNFVIDGKSVSLPLCDLRVHICEVETEFVWPYIPIYYQRIPDWVIQEISQKLKDLHVAIQPPIFNPHGPGPNPGPYRQFKKISLPLNSLVERQSMMMSKSVPSKPAPLATHVLQAITTGSLNSMRQALYNYHDILYPYLCLWPIYWPWIYSYDEETVVTTDCNGHFEMWENTYTEDGPLNIYIWVEAYIGGTWVTVYKPSLPCHTWWNYACGTDIHINITDPRVLPCGCTTEGPGDAFWFRSIGNIGGALHIEQNIANTRTIEGAPFLNAGCTDIIGYDWISPFGSQLNLEVFAGENVYASGTGVTHFRWKATRVATENLTSIPVGSQTPIILNAADKISREYMVHLDTFHYHSFNLDIAPSGTGDNIAFRIPNQNISLEPTILAAHPGKVPFTDIFWRDIFWTGGAVDSNSLANGLYRFDLELGKYDGSGNFVVTNVNPKTFQISEFSNLDNSQDPTSSYLSMSGGLAKNFTMLVRIDNAHCNADIHDAVLHETGALSGPCGFIKYTDVNQHIDLSFEASHPRNFAHFSFDVIKGNNTVDTGIHPSGYVNANVGGFTLAGGAFRNSYTVNALLNGCVGQAAFSENLYVRSIATDGYQRLSGYDKSDVNAFALSNS